TIRRHTIFSRDWSSDVCSSDLLLIFGIQPGPDLIEQDLDLVYFIVWSFAIASVVGAILAFFMARPLARLSYVSFPVLAAALIPRSGERRVQKEFSSCMAMDLNQ